jgi:pSer/pThr/pTyr-binding forkhead associated (FHA) protein
MSATVTLQVIGGPLCGAEFTYRLPGLCSVGRGRDCSLQVPNNGLYRTVSRHHCLLDIDPPEVRVCDLGSLNGTYINGRRIDLSDPEAEPDQLCLASIPSQPLHDGDALRVGDIVFKVGVRFDKSEPAADDPLASRSSAGADARA